MFEEEDWNDVYRQGEQQLMKWAEAKEEEGEKANIWPKDRRINGKWKPQFSSVIPSGIKRIVKSQTLSSTRHLAQTGGNRVGFILLIGMPRSKKPLGRPRQRWGRISDST